MTDDGSAQRWWGTFSLEAEGTSRWGIGPLELLVTRTAREWRVGHRRGEDLLDPTLAVARPAEEPDDEGLEWLRVAFAEAPATLRLRPRTADRALVIRPRDSTIVPSGERVTLYVSSPVWVELAVEEGDRRVADLPSWRPADTWFGDRAEGELCYAGRTRGVRSLDEIPMLPHRAVTPLHVVNEDPAPLSIDRISLPVTRLALYAGERGHLWTESATLIRHAGADEAEVRLGEGAPPEAGRGEAVSDPRLRGHRSFAARAFAGLFT